MKEFMDGWAEPTDKVLVIGVGGAGTNAVNCMMEEIKDVEFVCVDVDKQHVKSCGASTYMQIGERLTSELAVFERSEIHKKAVGENRDGLENVIKDFDMIIIICGMGGQTGTEAASVIARIAKSMGKLTIGIVTKPFCFEGEKRKMKALGGIEKLEKQVDSLIVISNDKLLDRRGEYAFKSGMFCMADIVFQQMVQGITDLITQPALISLDFADIVTVMKEKGNVYIGSGRGTGESRFQDAIREALTNPFVETSIDGASYVILNVTGEINLHEADAVWSDVQEKAGEDANVISSIRIDQECPNTVNITVIATGMKEKTESEFSLPFLRENFKTSL